MPFVLLYNIKPEKLRIIHFALLKLGLRSRCVTAAEFAHPIGYLLRKEAFSPSDASPESSFSDEMLVLADFSAPQINEFLSMLRSNSASVSLKAALTETNAAWSSLQLHEELLREHAAMQGLRPKEPKKRFVHKKK